MRPFYAIAGRFTRKAQQYVRKAPDRKVRANSRLQMNRNTCTVALKRDPSRDSDYSSRAYTGSVILMTYRQTTMA